MKPIPTTVTIHGIGFPKLDPRGPEYGVYTAALTPSLEIAVSKLYVNGDVQFTMYLTEEASFVEWVKETL